MSGKLLMAILFCFSTLNVVCETSPFTTVGEKNSLQTLISSASDHFGTLMPQRIPGPRKTGTMVLYRTKARTLLNLPQGQQSPQEVSHETKTPGIENEDAVEADVKDLPTKDHIPSSGEKNSQSHHSKLEGTGHKRPSPHGTSKVSQQDMAAMRPGMKKKSSGFRWKVFMDQVSGYKHGKSKGNKKKRRSDSRTEEINFPPGRILAGALVLLFSIACVVLLWRKYKRKPRRTKDSKLGSVVIVSRMTGSDEEFSDGEIISEERIVAFKNNDIESATRSSFSQRPQDSDLSPQVMKITEPEPGEILVNSTSFTSLSSSTDSEDWVLAGEAPIESPYITSAVPCCQPLTPSVTFIPRKTLSASISMDSDEDMSETQTSADTKHL